MLYPEVLWCVHACGADAGGLGGRSGEGGSQLVATPIAKTLMKMYR